MQSPSLEQVDAIRKQGFRPGVVGCILNAGRLLLLFKREYKLWMLPQGGVDNKEDLSGALVRELAEELGEPFVSSLGKDYTLVFEDRIEFNKRNHGDRELKTDNGTPIKMLGKHYYYFVVASTTNELNLGDTEFDQYEWVDYIQGTFLATRLYQKNKAAALQKVLDILKEQQLIES